MSERILVRHSEFAIHIGAAPTMDTGAVPRTSTHAVPMTSASAVRVTHTGEEQS
ncbi:hypothetical protein DFR70_101287 [Nocardia tenerifensis]|uniref:Uncharacterized protein n=1 Tax=Nocardia tenerifensis TaxID=228006 RepID=A0A318K9U9_9NOCA|nr:hypothetical protein DFR70_101287 [Nocardia tenerifensis]